MGGHPAEQIIAGVVLSERLAVTPYGAIHRAQWNGKRDLRGLVVEARLLGETAFRDALMDARVIAAASALTHPAVVPIVAVEAGGADVVVVTRGVGRYVTVQDLIVAARAGKANGGKLAPAIAASIGRSVIEALKAAHAVGVVHGAVHPRSVLVDEDGRIALGDFVVGRALATAVAQGADAALWRGLSGYLAPELAVGEDPTPGCDVFAAGALLFSMLAGEAPPGPLRSTPAVERLVSRALDTDPARRYKNAADLLENVLEAFEDDGWDLAERTEIITVAGLSGSETAIDDATEDLLASLGSSTNAVQVTPIRPSMDIRAEAVAARHNKTPSTANRLDALLADLDDSPVVARSPARAPSPLPAAPSGRFRPRVPSLDDPDDDDEDGYTPLPAPSRDSERDILPPRAASGARTNSQSERDALDSLAGLDDSGTAIPAHAPAALPPSPRAAPPRRTGQAPPLARPRRGDSELDELIEDVAPAAPPPKSPAAARPRSPAAAPLVDAPVLTDLPAPRLKSRLRGVIGLAVIVALGVGFYVIYQGQVADRAAAAKLRETRERALAEQEQRMAALQATQGAVRITSTPSDASVWLKLGRTPVDSMVLPTSMMHELRIEGLEGYQPLDTQVLPASWSTSGELRVANVVVPLTASQADAKGRRTATKLPAMPPKPPTVTGFQEGRGTLHIESTPRGAEVWLLVGVTNGAELSGIEAGVPYEFRVLKDGFHPAYISVSADDWRAGGDPREPLAVAKKKSVVEKAVELAPEKGR